ncbi:MAG TPA: hypothetical protein DCF49_04020 [Lachnospiraceae bacterium]|nr:hypothetical protein [Lachnospiraceae bacterium]
MLIKYLEKEQFLLKNTLKHHIDGLCARDNPQGILLCQKHKGSFRWKRRYLQNGLPVTVPLRKSEKELAEKLAVNLYRLVCILYLQKRLSRLGNMVRQFRRGPGHGSSESGKAGIGVSPGGGRGPGAESDQYEPDDFLTGNPLFRILDRLRNLPESPADFFRASSPYRPLLLSYLSNQYSALIDWYLGAFCQNSEHPEHLQFPVKLGYKVRSTISQLFIVYSLSLLRQSVHFCAFLRINVLLLPHCVPKPVKMQKESYLPTIL